MTLDPTLYLEGRIKDSRGVVMPWFTEGALAEIDRWWLAGRTVLEWGGGWSSLWWASRGAIVTVIEHHQEWIDWVKSQNPAIQCIQRDCTAEACCAIPPGLKPDIAIVDGGSRELDHVTLANLLAARVPRIIVDNWNQPSVAVNVEAIELMAKEGGAIYRQRGHADWQTAIFTREDA